jgi:microtubule-associated protein tau
MDDSLGTIEEELEQLELSTDTDSGVDDSTQQQQRPKSARGIAPINTTLPSVNTSSRMTTNRTLRRPSSRIPTKTVAEEATPGTANDGRTRTRTSTASSSGRLSRSQSTPATPKPRFNFGTTNTSATGPKKVPMNRVVVGTAPSPNLTVSQARIGSLANASHKPGGGQVRIESRKLEWTTSARTSTMRPGGHQAGGGDKKIEQRRLKWNAESKVGSPEKVECFNTSKIET